MSGQQHGLLAIWHDIEPGAEAAFHDWHSREHLPERMAVPGFLRARRYEAVTGGPRYFNDYLVESRDVLTSPAYLERLNAPSSWTSRVVPSFRGVNRSVCRPVVSAGQGEGGLIATLRFAPEQLCDADGLAAMLPGLADGAAIPAVRLWQGDAGASLLETAETKLRAGGTGVAAWVLALEGQFSEDLETAIRDVLARMRANGMLEGEPQGAVYRLLMRLEAPGR
ncbi:DUF4286 family protein [Geminicoccaceae bacterium 1502E]|nr:DUF4286 family protein [Geminicoccaceae bacterium 1502E]